MKGTVAANLELTFSFHHDGNLIKIDGASVDGVELPLEITKSLWDLMRNMEITDDLLCKAFEDAEPDCDDFACDDARITK